MVDRVSRVVGEGGAVDYVTMTLHLTPKYLC